STNTRTRGERLMVSPARSAVLIAQSTAVKQPAARSIEGFSLLHCHALRLNTASTRQALQVFLMHFMHAHVAVAYPTRLLQALTNSVSLASQHWAFDHYTT